MLVFFFFFFSLFALCRVLRGREVDFLASSFFINFEKEKGVSVLSLEKKLHKLADARAAVVGARRTALAAAMPAAAVAAAATLGAAGGNVVGGGGVGASSIHRNTDDDAASSSTTTAATARRSLKARILAAAGASFVSVIVVNPFDVVKVGRRRRTGEEGDLFRYQ